MYTTRKDPSRGFTDSLLSVIREISRTVVVEEISPEYGTIAPYHV
jgi:hypothetical protein